MRSIREKYARYLEGKSVVLVGRSAYITEQTQGEFIDSHDIVVRVNDPNPHARFGADTKQPDNKNFHEWRHSDSFILRKFHESIGRRTSIFYTIHNYFLYPKNIDKFRQDRDTPWLASVNIYDPHPPFNPPQTYREMFDPAEMPGPLFRETDLEQQKKLEAVDFQSRGQSPDRLDIKNPIVPQSPGSSTAADADSIDARDAKSLQAAYYAMIKLIDDQVGRILESLEETGQREKTVILFTSDHGEMLGDHGLIQKGCRFYEGLVRVPLIVSWPGHIESGLKSDALVELLDKAPTLLELAGLKVPDRMQGRSLLPILQGEVSEDRRRDFVRCEYYDAIDMPDGTFATMYRDRSHKLVVYHGHQHGELYDLEADPGEFENLWDEPSSQGLKLDLMKRSYDSSMLAMDRGPRRVGPI